MTGFKKGDVVAKVSTSVAHYGFDSGRVPTISSSIEIIRVSSASKDGRVKSFQTRNGSPVYKHDDRYGRVKFLAIGGENQPKAIRLYEAAQSTDSLRFDDPESARAAIAGA
jgi:hypothetical protein